MEPDIHKYDDWPLQKHSPPWIYKGCPAKKKHIPLVGHTYLMHLWQNPSHSDLQTFNSQPQSIGHRLFCLLGFKRSHGTANKKIKAPGPNENSRRSCTDNEHRQDIELAATNSSTSVADHAAALHEARDFRSSYVFLRTPKKLGEQLIADDEDPPEAWVCSFLSLRVILNKSCISFPSDAARFSFLYAWPPVKHQVHVSTSKRTRSRFVNMLHPHLDDYI